jgi:hypothetical protein
MHLTAQLPSRTSPGRAQQLQQLQQQGKEWPPRPGLHCLVTRRASRPSGRGMKRPLLPLLTHTLSSRLRPGSGSSSNMAITIPAPPSPLRTLAVPAQMPMAASPMTPWGV